MENDKNPKSETLGEDIVNVDLINAEEVEEEGEEESYGINEEIGDENYSDDIQNLILIFSNDILFRKLSSKPEYIRELFTKEMRENLKMDQDYRSEDVERFTGLTEPTLRTWLNPRSHPHMGKYINNAYKVGKIHVFDASGIVRIRLVQLLKKYHKYTTKQIEAIVTGRAGFGYEKIFTNNDAIDKLTLENKELRDKVEKIETLMEHLSPVLHFFRENRALIENPRLLLGDRREEVKEEILRDLKEILKKEEKVPEQKSAVTDILLLRRAEEIAYKELSFFDRMIGRKADVNRVKEILETLVKEDKL